jgi:hypothetical protein
MHQVRIKVMSQKDSFYEELEQVFYHIKTYAKESLDLHELKQHIANNINMLYLL